MPKMKTRKAVAKRFKVSKNGKIMHGRARTGHLKTHRSSKATRNLRKEKELSSADRKRVKKMLPGI